MRLLFLLTTCIALWLAFQLSKWKEHRIQPARLSASAVFDKNSLPERAFDGDADTYWASGDNPVQWVEADLGATFDLTTVTLTISQTGRWPTAHEIYVSDIPIGNSTSQARLVYRIDGVTDNRQIAKIAIPPEAGAVGRYVQIRTTRSNGWVAWRDIAINGRQPIDRQSIWGRLGLGAAPPRRAD